MCLYINIFLYNLHVHIQYTYVLSFVSVRVFVRVYVQVNIFMYLNCVHTADRKVRGILLYIPYYLTYVSRLQLLVKFLMFSPIILNISLINNNLLISAY